MLYEDRLLRFAVEERRECMAPGCGCRQYECVEVTP